MDVRTIVLEVLPGRVIRLNSENQKREELEYRLEEINLQGAWSGPGALELNPHALAPVAAMPVLEILSAVHILADLTLPLGTVAYDYLIQSEKGKKS